MAKKQLSSPPPAPLGAQEQLFSFFRMQSTSARKGGKRRGWGWSTARETEKGEVGLLFSLPFNFLGKEQEEEERDRVREGGSITRWPARAEEEEEEAEYPVVGQSVVKSSDYRLIGILLAWTDDGGGRFGPSLKGAGFAIGFKTARPGLGERKVHRDA